MIKTNSDQNPDKQGSEPQRIAKVMARAGLCSRREAERWIADRRVTIDGEVITSPAVTVTDANQVVVDGKPLAAPERARLWRYNKPVGVMTTSHDPQGRPTVFDAMPHDMPRVIAVGRLDLNSEGLLLLTNDGALARILERPQTGMRRSYRVRVHGVMKQSKLDSIAKGITVEGVHYGPIDATLERQQGSNAWLNVVLREGKNREIRRVFEHLGYPVNRLIRTAYGPVSLGDLPRGAVDEVTIGVVKKLMGETHKGVKAKPKPVKPGYKKAGSRRARAAAKEAERQSTGGGKPGPKSVAKSTPGSDAS